MESEVTDSLYLYPIHRRHSIFVHIQFILPPFHSLFLLSTVASNMFTRLAARPHIRQIRLPSSAWRHRHAFNTRTRDVLVARRAWSSTPFLKQEDKADSTPASEQPSTRQKPPFLTRVKTVAKWTAFLGASSVVGVLIIGGAIFLHDAFTYTERHVDRVPVNPLALHPETGGPKNLPIAAVLVGDEEDEENKKLSTKPRLVIVGGGWGVRSSVILIQTRLVS